MSNDTQPISTTDEAREQALAEAGGRCCMCPPHISYRVEVVPIVPVTEGGDFVASNLAALCPFCRWLVQRQRVSPTALRTLKRGWTEAVGRTPAHFKHENIRVLDQPLRFEVEHEGQLTVLEGSEMTSLLANFFNCLDTFLVHEDQHLENAISLAVIRAFRDMYNYVPSEQEIKEHSTADSRKLDLLYKAVRLLFSGGMNARGKSEPSRSRPAAKVQTSGKSRPAARGKSAPKKPVKKSAKPKPAKKKPAAAKRSTKKKAGRKR